MFPEGEAATQESVRYIEEVPNYLEKLEKLALWKISAEYLRDPSKGRSYDEHSMDTLRQEINGMFPDLHPAHVIRTQSRDSSRFMYKIVLDCPYLSEFQDILMDPGMKLDRYQTDLDSIKTLPLRNEPLAS